MPNIYHSLGSSGGFAWSSRPLRLLTTYDSRKLIARMTRSSVMEVTSEEYIGYARAKGLKEKTVVLKHTLRPALPSIITMVGMQAGYLLGGSIVIENLFSYPGMGQLLMAAVSVRDYELMQGITFFFVLAFLTINLIVDLLYGRIDPRIRSE